MGIRNEISCLPDASAFRVRTKSVHFLILKSNKVGFGSSTFSAIVFFLYQAVPALCPRPATVGWDRCQSFLLVSRLLLLLRMRRTAARLYCESGLRATSFAGAVEREAHGASMALDQEHQAAQDAARSPVGPCPTLSESALSLRSVEVICKRFLEKIIGRTGQLSRQVERWRTPLGPCIAPSDAGTSADPSAIPSAANEEHVRRHHSRKAIELRTP